MANVDILKEVKIGDKGEYNLCFQWCRYNYDDSSPSEHGYRFIWRRDNGSLQAARGQARIPSFAQMNELITKAAEAGWLGSVEK